MAVFRVEKTKDFTVMSNHHLRNVSLSLKAKGLLSLMLSLPDNWDYTTKGLAHICKDGVDSISSAIKELEKQGYLTRHRLRDAHGRLGDIEYVIHEKPVLPNGHDTVLPPKRENPRQVNPRQVKPVLGKPEQEKPAQLNIQESITEKSITDISNIHQSAIEVVTCNCTEKCEAGAVNTDCPVCKNDLNGCLGKVTEEPAPEETEQPEAETEKSGGNTGMIIFLVIALVAAGGLGYYFKIVRPKQQAAMDEDEFEDDGYGEDDETNEEYGEPDYLTEDDFDDKDSK